MDTVGRIVPLWTGLSLKPPATRADVDEVMKAYGLFMNFRNNPCLLKREADAAHYPGASSCDFPIRESHSFIGDTQCLPPPSP
jgi:hypothetical protein